MTNYVKLSFCNKKVDIYDTEPITFIKKEHKVN